VHCDGLDTLDALAEEAIARGMTSLGFSSHAYTPVGLSEEYSILTRGAQDDYIADVKRVQALYKDKIDLYLGTECDYFSVIDKAKYEYVIGSLHYTYKDGNFLSVDHSAEISEEGVRRLFGGDFKEYVKNYYSIMADMVRKTGCDVIGHFDVVTKFNENQKYFDDTASWYLDCAFEAAYELVKSGVLFEINTGAMTRGLRTTPYPSRLIADFIAKNGGKFILNSDCHNKKNLMFAFDFAEKYYDGIEIIDYGEILKKKYKK